MLRKPTVTVIVPLFNNERTICDTLQSIINTSYEQLEIIVFNDGSTDSSLEKVNQFKANLPNTSPIKINIISHPKNENRGVSLTRNKAIKFVNTSYVSFLDADDLYLPNRFDEVLSLLDADPNIDAAYGLFERYRESSLKKESLWLQSIYPDSGYLENNFSNLLVRDSVSLQDFLSGASGIHISTITFKTSSLRKLDGFPHLTYGEDTALLLRAISTQKVVKATEKTVSIYRINDDSSCFRGCSSFEFNFSDVLAYIDTIKWLSKKHDSNISAEFLKSKISGKLFHSYSKYKNAKHGIMSYYDRKKIFFTYIKCSILDKRILLMLNFYKVILKILFH